MRSVFCSFMALCLLVAPAAAQHSDHSHHHATGEALGTVRFENTCHADVQATFTRAVALLHSFGYDEARADFMEVAAKDPECGMAHWGIAMTYYHPLWAPPTPDEFAAGKAAAERAASVGAKSERERRYIRAIGAFYADPQAPHGVRAKAYTEALEQVASAHALDDEAQIFFALALQGTAPPNDTTYAYQKRSAAILNPLVRKLPDHPGILHYTIHAFDVPALAHLALDAARSYAKVAPSSSHALHMPSHIFTRLGLWRECIASNLDSAAAARTQAQAGKHPEAASFNELHALDYLAYAYLQLGDDDAAREVVEKVEQATKFDEANVAAAYAVAAAPARFALERRDWKAAASLRVAPVLMPLERLSYIRAVTYFANAIGAARMGNPAAARRAVGELEAVHAGVAKAPPAGPYDWAGQVEAMQLAASGWTAFAEGRTDEAVTLLTKAAEKEELVGKHPVTPGAVLPARELLGDLLLELARPADALAAYERSLKDAPKRLNTLAGATQAAKKAGDGDRAQRYAAELASLCARCTRPAVQRARAVVGSL